MIGQESRNAFTVLGMPDYKGLHANLSFTGSKKDGAPLRISRIMSWYIRYKPMDGCHSVKRENEYLIISDAIPGTKWRVKDYETFKKEAEAKDTWYKTFLYEYTTLDEASFILAKANEGLTIPIALRCDKIVNNCKTAEDLDNCLRRDLGVGGDK